MPQAANKLNICVPTSEELTGIQKYMGTSVEKANWHVTGMGVFSTSYHVLRIIRETGATLLIHAGIAGSYAGDIHLGQVVEVHSERLVDFGAERADGTFISFQDIVPSVNIDSPPFHRGELVNVSAPMDSSLRTVSGLTVPFATGSRNTLLRRSREAAEIETMEGAAFFYTCLLENVSFHSFRGISNHVNIRDREDWNVYLALENLGKELKRFL